MKRYLILTALVAAASLGGASLAGRNRLAAVAGAGAATLSAIVALAGFERAIRAGARATQRALLVVSSVFLLRLLLVALGVMLVDSRDGSLTAFVVAFFVPYFAFQTIEGLHVHARSRRLEVAS